MAEHLTPLDATFLELEQADDSALMHIGAVMVFEPLESDGAPSVELVREHLDARLGTLPRFRQRLSTPRVEGLTWPTWDRDRHFDIAAHVRRATLPAPGSEGDLLDWAADFWSHPLDRSRPLWEMVVLDGLDGGRWALATKTHHSMVDGIGSVDVAYLMLDAEPEPAAPPEAPAATDEHEEEEEGAAGGRPSLRRILTWAPNLVLHGARTGVEVVTHPDQLRSLAERARALAELVVRNEVVAAPKSSINVPIGATRRLAAVYAPLADLKAIKNGLGGTVNDVALAVVAGGLHALLTERGDRLPPQGLRAMVPMNIRAAGERLALGNRITSLFVHVPVAEQDPMVRYEKTLGETKALKAGTQPVGGETLVEIAGLAPPALHTFVAQSLFATRLFNITITNVPGPQQTLYAFGAPLRRVVPLVPLAAEHALGIAVVSYDGVVTFSLCADRAAMPDLDRLAAGIESSLEELRELARAPAPEPAA